MQSELTILQRLSAHVIQVHCVCVFGLMFLGFLYKLRPNHSKNSLSPSLLPLLPLLLDSHCTTNRVMQHRYAV